MRIRCLAVLLLLAAMFTSSRTVHAQQGCGGLGGFGPGYYGYLYGYGQSFASLGNLPPYFSLHPPVYYGKIRPLTYGDSPFVYPFGYDNRHTSPHRQGYLTQPAAKPLMITNPYASAGSPDAAPAPPDLPSPRDGAMVNPYTAHGPAARAIDPHRRIAGCRGRRHGPPSPLGAC